VADVGTARRVTGQEVSQAVLALMDIFVQRALDLALSRMHW